MQEDQILTILTLVFPVAIIILSLPLVYEKVPPNRGYGFRTRKTRSSEQMWYRTNKLGGQYFIVAAIFQLAGALILLAWPGTERPQIAGELVVLLPILIALLAWWLRIRTF
jgi:uncharacterized membrane protein